MARKRIRTQYKKKLLQPKNEVKPVEFPYCSTPTSSEKLSKVEEKDMHHSSKGLEVSSSVCSTPKAQRHRIPTRVLCPPAPKKRRILSHCSSQRKPISFFAPPDIEHFFCFALQTIV
ncbi:hypothetical protein IFM89_017335 [Coptis chinensis]|uniref:Uncharacterized protein n=1 Tax=Coptis chinensis TaxID=261450 RepID=A0A835LFH4_9MAGN|nr:hypothetical protein IFM89_017335 [Coptis chinensis]